MSSALIVRAHRIKRRLLRSDVRLQRDYMDDAFEPKLHIGGGWHTLDGWLNTDLDVVPGVMIMDASKRFPFASGTMQFVFSEHMIEHIPFEGGARMLAECHRVMRPGGVIRITTPDLGAILGLRGESLSSEQKRYVAWFCETFVRPPYPATAASVINAHFRMWGHQFLYDEVTLTEALRRAGFGSIERQRLGNSKHAPLRNLENTGRYPDGLLDFESMALEATKPCE